MIRFLLTLLILFPSLCQGTDDFPVNISTGNTSKNIVLANTALTSGKIPAATTNGRLTDATATTILGSGIPAIIANVNLTNQGADIGTTAFANTNVAGSYRVSMNISTSTNDALAGAVSLNILWADQGGSTSDGLTQVLTAQGGQQKVIFCKTASTGSVSYSISHTGIFSNAKFAVNIAVERLQ